MALPSLRASGSTFTPAASFLSRRPPITSRLQQALRRVCSFFQINSRALLKLTVGPNGSTRPFSAAGPAESRATSMPRGRART